MQMIIDIPDNEYKQNKHYYDSVYHGIPLDSVKAEIKKKCDSIDDIARANMYQYAPHREIQDLLCEIIASIDNAESEVKPNE